MVEDRRVLEDLRPLLHSAPKLDLTAPLEVLREYLPSPVSTPPKVEVWDEALPAADGAELRVRLYKPLKTAAGPLGAMYWIHGGGMIAGAVEMDEYLCECFATGAGCIVASIEYRLAPEFPYPTPVEDCYSGLAWFAAQSGRLGFHPGLLAVGGASAGGNLCAAVALMARDRGGPRLFFQMPLYPMLDDRCDTPSALEVTSEFLPMAWNNDASRTAWAHYLKNVQGEVPAYAAPARAQDLSGLPAAYTCIGGLDPFRDETIRYVQRLVAAGVDVEFHLCPGACHAWDQPAVGLPSGRRAFEEYTDAVRRAFAKQRKEGI